jgi:hypothetical protein
MTPIPCGLYPPATSTGHILSKQNRIKFQCGYYERGKDTRPRIADPFVQKRPTYILLNFNVLLRGFKWIICFYRLLSDAAQSVYWLITDSTTGVRSPSEAKDFSSSFCVQTGSEAHQAYYRMCTGGSFPGGKARPGCEYDISPHLVPILRMSRG